MEEIDRLRAIENAEDQVYDLCEKGQEQAAIEILKTLTFSDYDEARTLMDEAAIDNDCPFVMTYLMKNSKDGPSVSDIAQCEAVKCASVLFCSDFEIDMSSFIDNTMTLEMVKFSVDRLGSNPNNFLQITEEECDQEMVDFLIERGANDIDEIGAIAAKLGNEKLTREMLSKGADKEDVMDGLLRGPLHELTFELTTEDNKEAVAMFASTYNNFHVLHYLIDKVDKETVKKIAIKAAIYGRRNILDLCLPYYNDYAVLYSKAREYYGKEVEDYLLSLHKGEVKFKRVYF